MFYKIIKEVSYFIIFYFCSFMAKVHTGRNDNGDYVIYFSGKEEAKKFFDEEICAEIVTPFVNGINLQGGGKDACERLADVDFGWNDGKSNQNDGKSNQNSPLVEITQLPPAAGNCPKMVICDKDQKICYDGQPNQEYNCKATKRFNFKMGNKKNFSLGNDLTKREDFFTQIGDGAFLEDILWNDFSAAGINKNLSAGNQITANNTEIQCLKNCYGNDNPENLVRMLQRDLMELKYSMKNVKNKQIDDQMIRLLAISRAFSNVNDGCHKNALFKLSAHIQSTLNALQNPPDCRKARILLIEWTGYCGLGCALHFVGFALTMAAASNRVLLLKDDGNFWNKNGWNSIFKPITKCNYVQSIELNVDIYSFPLYTMANQTERIVWMPSRWGPRRFDGYRQIEHMPHVMPREYASFLQQHHSNPPAWFLGQFLHFLWKPVESILEKAKNLEANINFEKGPIIGIDVRRTDKIAEANYQSLDEYMKWAKFWFDVEEYELNEKRNLNGIRISRRIFIATDEPKVIEEARNKFSGNGPDQFQIYAIDQNAQDAMHIENRYTYVGVAGMITEIHALIHCDFVICTFSSNVCLLVFELMQALKGNAGDRVKSLDSYYEDFSEHYMEAINDYQINKSGEIEAKRGDTFEVYYTNVFWNGSVLAKNLETGKSGLFPAYLLRDHYKIASFPIFYDEILIKNLINE